MSSSLQAAHEGGATHPYTRRHPNPGTRPAGGWQGHEYRELALAVIRLATEDAQLERHRHHAPVQPEALGARARFRLESARVWVTKRSAGLELWSRFLQIASIPGSGVGARSVPARAPDPPGPLI